MPKDGQINCSPSAGNLTNENPTTRKEAICYTPVRRVHATRRDAAVGGPRSPAERGAALERPILLEASYKSRSLGDFGPLTPRGRHGPGHNRTTTQHVSKEWCGTSHSSRKSRSRYAPRPVHIRSPKHKMIHYRCPSISSEYYGGTALKEP